MRVLKPLALFVFCCGVPVALWEFLPRTNGPVPPISYAELVAILLTGITVVLAILAVIVGILAIWGYQSIKSEAIGAAERKVIESVGAIIDKRLADKSIQARIEKGVSAVLNQSFGKVLTEYSNAFPQHPEGGDGSEQPAGSVAEEYPNEESHAGT